jgi:hypothetical protein
MSDWSRFNDQFRETHAERTKRLRDSYRKQRAEGLAAPAVRSEPASEPIPTSLTPKEA